MGITGKAFQKLHDISTVSKSQPTKFGAVPQRNFGGLIRKAADSAQVTSKVGRCTAGELGTIVKAKDAKGHGSDARDGGGIRQTRPFAATIPDSYKQSLQEDADKTGTHRGIFCDTSGKYRTEQINPHAQYTYSFRTDGGPTTPKAGDGKVGKSLSIFGLMQGLAKAKDAKGHGSEKRGGGGSGAGGDLDDFVYRFTMQNGYYDRLTGTSKNPGEVARKSDHDAHVLAAKQWDTMGDPKKAKFHQDAALKLSDDPAATRRAIFGIDK